MNQTEINNEGLNAYQRKWLEGINVSLIAWVNHAVEDSIRVLTEKEELSEQGKKVMAFLRKSAERLTDYLNLRSVQLSFSTAELLVNMNWILLAADVYKQYVPGMRPQTIEELIRSLQEAYMNWLRVIHHAAMQLAESGIFRGKLDEKFNDHIGMIASGTFEAVNAEAEDLCGLMRGLHEDMIALELAY